MTRYNEDPCLNLNGPERKFKKILEVLLEMATSLNIWNITVYIL